MKNPSYVMLFLMVSVLAVGCVSERKYSELKAEFDDCVQKRDRYLDGFKEVELKYKSESEVNEMLRDQLSALRLDSAECNQSLIRTRKLYHDLQELQQRIIENTKDEQERTRRDLMQTSELLRARERDLQEKEENLRSNQQKIRNLESDLAKREARVAELESILNAKDSSVQALRANMQRALFNFENSGLTVEIKNGKVYVSLEEKLLFRSGSIEVDARGRNALLELAKALAEQEEVSIMVEGHTDDVPMRTASIKDNWDLSVLRATSIVRILTQEGGLSPQRIMASGRGEFVPLVSETTPEARAKNRRTEIILTPKLDELLEILSY